MSNESNDAMRGVSRRSVLKGGVAAGVAAALGAVPAGVAAGTGALAGSGAAPGGDAPAGSGGADLVLVNGRIHTMDGSGTVARTAVIRNGRFAAVGNAASNPGGARVVNLKGRTVVPGIIDNHNHIVLMGNRPGFHTPLENALSIADVQDTVAGRAGPLAAGSWITTIGGFHFNQFAEGRMANLDELTEAAPNHPVYQSISFSGPSTTNAAGKAILEGAGVPVAANGTIAANAPTGAATLFLRQTLLDAETRKRGALDAMAYGAGLGVTTHIDEGAFQKTDTPADGAAHEDNFSMHLPFLELYAEGRLGTRLRINFLNLETDPAAPQVAARLRNAFPFFGGDLVKTGGIGEFTGGDPFELFFGPGPSAAWVEATRKVAAAGWRNENHSLSATDFQHIIAGWEAVDADFPIGDLRWVLAHVPFITESWVDRLKALGGGLSLTGWRYLSGTSTQNGPPFRMIVDNGIPAGMSSDGMQIAPMNPWIHMYYATTGRNARGDVINGDQTISREEVLRLYTAANGWFVGEEDDLGSIEVGKFGDLVVLDRDYFSVPDAELRQVSSVLTVVGGAIVHDAGVL